MSSRKRRQLRIKRRRRHGVVIAVVVLGFFGALAVVGIGSGATLLSSCDLSSLRPVAIGQNSFVYANDGSLLGSIPAERNREPVALRELTPLLPRATVAIEDKRFYSHGGVDVEGIVRALWRDVSAGRVVEGGSTITQQLVRNLYISREVTVQRKLKEACLAIKLSRSRSKDWILENYMNQVYYGNHAYGVEAAAQTYFSRHASSLTLLQAALLAGLPQAPTDYDPFHAPQKALARRSEVLRAMLANGAITVREYQRAARSRSLGLRPGRLYTRIKQPYFFGYVSEELQKQYGTNTIRSGGLRVYTTIDPRLQRAAQRSIREVLYAHDDPASAIVSIDPSNGAIRAMTAVIPGNRKNQFNLAAQSERQAGSTFKAFVLAAAIEQGIDPDTTYYTSAPFTCTTGPWCLPDVLNGKPWHVETYGHDYLGSTSITNATIHSDNTVFAQLGLDVGPQAVWTMAKRLGVNLSDPPVASISLGPLRVSPLDMATAYATLASGGVRSKPMAITKVILPGGKVDTDSGWGKPQRTRAISDGVAWKVTQVLEQNAQYGTGAGSGDGRHPVAGKTGTTERHADAWFCGYTPQLATTVWMGYPRGEIPMLNVHGQAVAGATFPVPIWHRFMAAALWRSPVKQFPTPRHYPVYHSFTRGNYGTYSSYSSSTGSGYTNDATTTSSTHSTATTPKPQGPPAPAPKPKPTPTPTPTPPPPTLPTTTTPPPPPPPPPTTTPEP
jgi:penicillin-binding protein 1A